MMRPASNSAALAEARPVPSDLDADDVFASVAVSPRGRVLRSNARFRELLGHHRSVDELEGKDFIEEILRQSSDWAQWKQVADCGEARNLEMELVGVGDTSVFLVGTIELVQLRGEEPFLRGVLVDNTPSHHLKELSLKTARMEGALSLAAGVSHDFNNLLTVLVGNLYLVSELTRADQMLHEKVRKARDTAKRGADFSRQLLEVARGASTDAEAAVLSPERIVEQLTPLLAAALGSRVSLETSFDAESALVKVNRSQLESVVTNLVINARDAVAGDRPGHVVIAVKKVDLSAAQGAPLKLKAGFYVQISVEDDGCGVPAHLVQSVFQPFFSTKGKGKGNGLGLPMVRWFAEKAGGAAFLKSQPNKGTTVSILLPAQHGDASSETGALTMPLSALPSGNEAIVIVSDDSDFRSTVEQILGTLGYRLTPESMLEALLEKPSVGRSVLIVDANKLTAVAADRARRLVRLHGAAVGLVVVGNSRLDWLQQAVRVSKPFNLMELARAVRAAADGG